MTRRIKALAALDAAILAMEASASALQAARLAGQAGGTVTLSYMAATEHVDAAIVNYCMAVIADNKKQEARSENIPASRYPLPAPLPGVQS